MDSSHPPKDSPAIAQASSPSTINASTSGPANTYTTVPKLRDSCVACAASKVRCHRQKPSCSKCVARGIPCKYVRSKRGGRNPAPRAESQADTTGSSTGSSTSSRKGRDSGGSETGTSVERESPQLDLPLSSARWVGGVTVPPDPPFPMPTTMSMFINTKSSSITVSDPLGLSPSVGGLTGLESDADEFVSSASNFDYGLDLGDLDPFSMVFNEHSDNEISLLGNLTTASDSKACSPPLSVTDPQCSVRPPFGFNSDILQNINATELQGWPCECSTQAAALVKQYLTDPSVMSSPSSGTSTPTTQIQPIIFQNKQAIETIEAVLQCSCSRDCYLLVMLSMILLKVMDSYAEASNNKHTAFGRITVNTRANDIGGDDVDERGSTSSDQHKSLGRLRPLQTPSPASYGHKKHSPISFSSGSENVGSARSSMHMVLGELHRPQRLVNQLSERLKAEETKGSGCDTSSSHRESGLDKCSILGGGAHPCSSFLFSDSLLRQLGLDLRRRLQNISQEIRQALKRELTG